MTSRWANKSFTMEGSLTTDVGLDSHSIASSEDTLVERFPFDEVGGSLGTSVLLGDPGGRASVVVGDPAGWIR